MKKIRYALVGFGGIAENRVAKEGYALDVKRFKPLKSAALTGAFDVNSARKEAAEALGLKWYDTLAAVLADKDVDGVYIATNNASHASIAITASPRTSRAAVCPGHGCMPGFTKRRKCDIIIKILP